MVTGVALVTVVRVLRMRRHCLDYGLVFLGENRTNMFHPGPTLADGAGESHDGFSVFKPIEEGDTTFGYAVHSLTNRSATDWLLCYQLELK
jgi:hypothetical protein